MAIVHLIDFDRVRKAEKRVRDMVWITRIERKKRYLWSVESMNGLCAIKIT